MKEYYAGQGSGHDYYMGQGSGGNQEFYTGQDYSTGQGSSHDSAPVEDDSSIEEVVTPVKAKKVSKRYDSILSKWKNKVHPRIGAFCAIFDNVQRRNESGSCDLTVYQKACVEYAADKKAKTSETTSSSAQGGLNLNEDADGFKEEVRDVRPIGRDPAKKKASSFSRSEALSVAGGDLKNRELDIHGKTSWEASELQRHELEIKRKSLELKLRNKRDKDLRFYMKKIDGTLPPIQQKKLKEMKQEIKELYDLEF
nr:hypothetical protein [Tanacetum cinerariifolium]